MQPTNTAYKSKENIFCRSNIYWNIDLLQIYIAVFKLAKNRFVGKILFYV